MSRSFIHLLLASSAAFVLSACPDNSMDAGDDDASSSRDATPVRDAEVHPDAAPSPDAGADDAEVPDAEAPDAEPSDGGSIDATPIPVAVAYAANAESIGMLELYFTDTSTSRTKVNPPMAGGPFGGKKGADTGGLQYFSWSSDGTTLVYEAQQDTFDFREIYMTRRAGARMGAPRKISLPTATSESAGFSFGPERYLELDQAAPGSGSSNMYIVDTSSVAPVPMRVSQGSIVFWFWSPLSPWIAIWDIIQSMTDRDLWLVDLRTGPNFTRERINPGANLGFGSAMAWSPDGRRIAYSSDERALRLFELFFTELDLPTGILGPRERVHPLFPADADIDVSLSGVAFSPDGSKLAYRADLATDNVRELFVVDMSGPTPGMPLSVNTPQLSGEGVLRMMFSPSSTRIAYVADPDLPDTTELFLVTLGGPTGPERVHTPLAMNGQIINEVFTQNGDFLLYTVFDGVSSRIFASFLGVTPLGPPIPLSDQLAADESTALFDVSPDGRTLIYRADSLTLDRSAFYLVDISSNPPGPPVRLSEGLRQSAWCWAPDSRLAVVSDRDQPGTSALYLVRNVAQPDLVRISGPIIEGGGVAYCAFPPR